MKQMEVNSILKDLYESNGNLHKNNLYLTAGMVKNYLQKRGIPENEQVFQNSIQCFQDWKNTFGENINLHMYFDASSNFSIKSEEIPTDCICMSISLDIRHISQGVKLIIDYLSRQNIPHKTTVKKEITTNGIVIRLTSREDAIKLQNFINNSRYLQEGMLPVNSFYPEDNKVGYTYNGSTSYDNVVSHIIANYINRMYEFGLELIDIDINSFYRYINAFMQDKNNISNLPFIEKNSEKETDATFILELLMKSLGSNNIDDYFKFYDYVQKIKHGRTNTTEDKEELFKEYVLTTLKKYPLGFDDKNPEKSGLDYIISFLNGNINGVTRENNLRERVKNNLTPNDVANILNSNYIPGTDLNQKLNTYIKMTMLNEMIRCSEISFPNQGLDLVNKFITNGSLIYITNHIDGARNLAMTLGPEGINILFRHIGVPNIYCYAEKFLAKAKQNGYQK